MKFDTLNSGEMRFLSFLKNEQGEVSESDLFDAVDLLDVDSDAVEAEPVPVAAPVVSTEPAQPAPIATPVYVYAPPVFTVRFNKFGEAVGWSDDVPFRKKKKRHKKAA